MKRHHVFFVPGIGDAHALGQDKGIALWRLLGMVPHYHPVGWSVAEPYLDKQNRLVEQIDACLAAGDAVSLLGFSAGASVTLNVFNARRKQIAGVVLVSGWLQPPSATNPRYFKRNPAFKESLETMMTHSLPGLGTEDKARFLTLNPLVDLVVPLKQGSIAGVRHWRTLAFGHVMSIAVALTVYAPFIVCHMRRSAGRI